MNTNTELRPCDIELLNEFRKLDDAGQKIILDVLTEWVKYKKSKQDAATV